MSARPRTTDRADFLDCQRAYFEDADEAKFRWQTTAPVFGTTEGDLVAAARGAGRFLEVGCGEGGNLFHLGPRAALTVGMDYSLPKVAFAARAISWGRFVGGNAVHLPFRRGGFDKVFCRDVLHHVPADSQREAVAEMFRVCRPGGEVVMIEPNGRNPLIAGLALVTPAERGLLQSTPERVVGLVRAVVSAVTVEMAQPLPLARALLHYRMGWPRLVEWRSVARLLSGTDKVLERLMPRPLWAYMIVRAGTPTTD